MAPPLPRLRWSVDLDAFALEVLRDGLPAAVTVARLRSRDFTKRLPWAQPRLIPGSDQVRMARFLTRGEIAVEYWAATARAAADLADAGVVAFEAARRPGRVFAGAALAGHEWTLPAEIREQDQLDDLFHWTATHTLSVRPAPSG